MKHHYDLGEICKTVGDHGFKFLLLIIGSPRFSGISGSRGWVHYLLPSFIDRCRTGHGQLPFVVQVDSFECKSSTPSHGGCFLSNTHRYVRSPQSTAMFRFDQMTLSLSLPLWCQFYSRVLSPEANASASVSVFLCQSGISFQIRKCYTSVLTHRPTVSCHPYSCSRLHSCM